MRFLRLLFHRLLYRTSPAYQLWDRETGNIVGQFRSLTELVQATAGFAQANPETLDPKDLWARTDA